MYSLLYLVAASILGILKGSEQQKGIYSCHVMSFHVQCCKKANSRDSVAPCFVFSRASKQRPYFRYSRVACPVLQTNKGPTLESLACILQFRSSFEIKPGTYPVNSNVRWPILLQTKKTIPLRICNALRSPFNKTKNPYKDS